MPDKAVRKCPVCGGLVFRELGPPKSWSLTREQDDGKLLKLPIRGVYCDECRAITFYLPGAEFELFGLAEMGLEP